MLLTGSALRIAVEKALNGSRALCAVAFWGMGSENLIGLNRERDTRIICNLNMGGTNPTVIEKMISQGINIHQCDTLHAKLYIGESVAVVTSANASFNGLGLNGVDAHWIEAGTVIPAHGALDWFEELWEVSRKIMIPEDLLAARTAFIRMEKVKNKLTKIQDGTTDSNIHKDGNISSAQIEMQSIYYGLSLRRAITVVLQVSQQPMTALQITEQLSLGGVATAAKTLSNSIHDALRDGERQRIFGHVTRGQWGLVGWPDVKINTLMTPKIRKWRGSAPPKNSDLGDRVRAGLAVARERGVKGGFKKLTPIQRDELLGALKDGARTKDIASRFGLSNTHVTRIKKAQVLTRSKSIDTTGGGGTS